MRQTVGRKRTTSAVRELWATRTWGRALLGLGMGLGLAAQAGAGARSPSDAPSAPEKRVVTPPPPLPADRPASVPTVNTPPEKVVENSYLDGALLYQLLLAEFDRSEGQPGDAIELMLEAARRNKDDALFRRSLEIAVEAGAGEKALAITKSW